jgi:photosynthetic reaction center cytochrome c subunit
MRFKITMLLAGFAVLAVGLALTFQWPRIVTVQRGYRGVAMAQVINDSDAAAKQYANQLPEAIPALDPVGQPSSAVYANVKVLGDVDAADFIRIMNAMTSWVAPQQGCGYCHDLNDLSSDALYTKVVARRMIQMVRHVNTDWKDHVASTGVTCYTCHRGQPVPSNIWFTDPGPETADGSLGNKAGQNAPLRSPGLSSLPFDPFTPFLSKNDDIRVVSTTALPDQDHKSIKQTEWTYALMMHMSTALGVNCTFCHNTRSFMDWNQSTPQRVTAWYGIRMVRDLNMNYLSPLTSVFPASRLGPTGDGPKANCATCHQGAYKPLFGASMVGDFPALGAQPATAPK